MAANPLRAMSDALEELVARSTPAVAGVSHRRGQGTAIVLAPDGWLLTNAHVVREAPALRIDFARGADIEGRVVGTDARTDLALVRVGAGNLRSLPLAERHATRVGQLVIAIGNPLHFDHSVSLGVVSALDRSLPTPGGSVLEGLVQTDAAINPGNSGGPLLDADGAVVGINTAVVPYAQGIGFAVPAHTVHWVASVLLRKGVVERPFLGVAARGIDLGAERSQAWGQPRGVQVLHVEPQSPAAAAGLRDGDVMLAANGAPIGSVDDLQRVLVLAELPEVELQLLRKSERHAVVARPGPAPAAA
jgi:S1-C subfamily serine protease